MHLSFFFPVLVYVMKNTLFFLSATKIVFKLEKGYIEKRKALAKHNPHGLTESWAKYKAGKRKYIQRIVECNDVCSLSS